MFEEVEDDQEEIDFEKLEKASKLVDSSEIRRVNVPFHRMNPLKKNWDTIVKLIVDKMKLLIRMNVKHRIIEIKNSEICED